MTIHIHTHSHIDTARAALLRLPTPDAIDRERPFKLLSAIHEPRPSTLPEGGQQSLWRSAVANRKYLTRDVGRDLFGPVPDWSAKRGDLGEHGRRGPIGCDLAAVEGMKLWQAADEAAAIDRPELAAAFHAIGWLPFALDDAGWRQMVLAFCDTMLVKNGMIADWAIHRLADEQGDWLIAPHVHLVITARAWRADRNPGRRNLAWFGSARSIKAAEDYWCSLVADARG